MPFTPFHFGIHTLIGLSLQKWLDLPVLVLASVVIDFEPLVVMFSGANYPLHGYAHTFLWGSILGLIWGLMAFYLFKNSLMLAMRLARLPYTPKLIIMLISGVLGVWLHVFVDSFMHRDIKPFWPVDTNPFADVITYTNLNLYCDIAIYFSFLIYIAILLIPAVTAKIRADQ